MSEALALKYRPGRFEDFIGQSATRVILQRMCHNYDVDRPLIFSGIRGTGKTSAGRVVAAALNCEAEDRPCTQCVSCKSIAAGTSISVIEKDGASSGLVDDIRTLTETLRYDHDGRYRVVLLDEAQSMSKAAFNALLKTLEEPPVNTVFIFLTTEPDKIPETILSRCMSFEFRKIAPGDIHKRLWMIVEKEGFDVHDDLLHRIADRSDGGMRDAIMVLDQCIRAGITTEAEHREISGETDFAPIMISAMASGDRPRVFDLLKDQLSRYGDASVISDALISTFKDVLILQGGGRLDTQGLSLHARQTLAETLQATTVVRACKVIWDAQIKFRTVSSPKVLTELLMVMLTETLAPTKIEAVKAPKQRMSLDQMRAGF